MKNWLSIFSAVFAATLAAGAALWWWNDSVQHDREQRARNLAAWQGAAVSLLSRSDWMKDPRDAMHFRRKVRDLLERAPEAANTRPLDEAIQDATAIITAAENAAREKKEAAARDWEGEARKRESSILALVTKITQSDAREKPSLQFQLQGEIEQGKLLLDAAPPAARANELRLTVDRARMFAKADG